MPADIAKVIASARSKLGAPYVWGAEGPDAFDCSGLMHWAFGQHGLTLPRVSQDQAKTGRRVQLAQRRPGDLIFSSWDENPDVDHVALYIGDDQYIHTPRAGDVVKIGKITDSYRSHITNVQRVTETGTGAGIIGGALGALGGGSLLDAVRAIGTGVQSAATGINAVGGLAQKAMWLALPTTQVRIVTGALGVGFLIMGVWLLAREAR